MKLDRSKCKVLMTEIILVKPDEVEFGYFNDGNPFVAVNDQVIPTKDDVLQVYCIDWPEHLRQAPVRDVVEYLINKQQNYNI